MKRLRFGHYDIQSRSQDEIDDYKIKLDKFFELRHYQNILFHFIPFNYSFRFEIPLETLMKTEEKVKAAIEITRINLQSRN